MELYVFEKVDKFVLPTSYDRYENGVTGLFTTESIRFYKTAIENIINYKNLREKYPEKKPKEIRNLLRYYNRFMETFFLDENDEVELKVSGTEHKDKYKFSKDLIIVKGDNFIDVTNKERLHDYITKYGFDEQYEEDIINNDVIALHRNPKKKLSFEFK